uniref:Glycosyltransferase n=1 Tax=Desulfovibrio sp. U5L TaxID=596152 RepID=I2Q705_9BACT
MLRSVFVKSSDLQTVKGLAHEDVVCVLPYLRHDLAVRLEEVLRVRAGQSGLLVLVEDTARLGFMRVANLVYRWTTSACFAYLAEDAFPGEQWLGSAVATLREAQAGLLPFNDGRFCGTLAVFGLVSRAWLGTVYPRFLFHPGYRSHFGDTELTVIAAERGKLIFNPASLLVEVDYEKHRKGYDQADAALYKARATTGFDGLVAPFAAP